jgi:hypothetical protein
MSDGSVRTYSFRPIRSLDTQLPVSASLTETFGDLTKRFCSLYNVPGGNYIIARRSPTPDVSLSSLPEGETAVTVWGNRESYPPFAALEARAEPPQPRPQLLPPEEEEEVEDANAPSPASSLALSRSGEAPGLLVSRGNDGGSFASDE